MQALRYARGSRAFQSSLKLIAAMGMATTMMTAATGPAQAFTQELQDMFEEFLDCKVLLLTNPDEHVRLCLGGDGRPAFPFSSLSTLQGANPPPPPPPPNEEEDDEEEEEEEECDPEQEDCEDEEEECDPYENCEEEEPPCCYSPCYPSCYPGCVT